ncbi:MAG: hypothetical protein RLZZ207_1836 [Bacteroidota bacterium]
MKKVFAIFAIAGLIATASCGGGADAEKAKQDSIATADSLAKVAADAAAAAEAEAAAATAKADSIRKADSIAASAKK